MRYSSASSECRHRRPDAAGAVAGHDARLRDDCDPVRESLYDRERGDEPRSGPDLRPAVPDHQPARRRRDGRGLPRLGLRAGAVARAEGDQAGFGSAGDAGARAPVQARARARATGHAHQRHPHPRHGRDRRHQVHHDAVRPWHRPRAPPVDGRQAADCPRAAARAADGVRTSRRARRGHRAPRSQARQHPDRRLGEGGHHRFRHRPVDFQPARLRRRPARSSGRWHTWRPNRRRASPSISAPTSTRSA